MQKVFNILPFNCYANLENMCANFSFYNDHAFIFTDFVNK